MASRRNRLARLKTAARVLIASLAVLFLAPAGRQARAGGAGVVDLPHANFVSPIDVLPDEPLLIYVYGEGFIPGTRVAIDGVGELLEQGVDSSSVLFGQTPPLPEGVSPGWKNLVVSDSRGSFVLESAVLYVQFGEPYIKECWPYEIGPEGGTLIHFHGRNFHAGMVPAFEGVPCTDPVLVSESEMTASSPPLEARPRFTLYNGEMTDGPGGPIVARRDSMLSVLEGMTLPVLSGVEPAEVDARGGSFVTIRGDGLRNDAQAQVYVLSPGGAFIGDIEGRSHAEPYVLVETIAGISPRMDPLDPATPPGLYDLVYRDPRGESVLAGAFHYLDNIRVVTPSQCVPEGGTAIAFEGYELENGWIPRLGGVPCTHVVYESSKRMTAVSPPLWSGRHDADMINDDGTVEAYLPGAVEVPGFSAPRITSVEPTTISTRGGDLFTVMTDSWHGGSVPLVGGIPLVNIDSSSPQVLRGETPPLPPGLHRVELAARDGTVIAILDSAVDAVEPGDITIESVAPFEVATRGGTMVHLTGTGFYPGLLPRLGGLPFSAVEVIDSEHLQGESPPLAEGPHDAQLEEAGAIRAVFPDAVLAVAAALPVPPVTGSLPSTRFSSEGTSRIAIPIAGFPLDAVLRVGGVAVLPTEPSTPCGMGAGAGRGAGAVAELSHRVLEGLVPPLAPGLYKVEVYQPGFGVLATLGDVVEVVPPDAPPVVARIVSGDVQPDGSSRIYLFGSAFGAETSILVGGVPLAGAVRISDTLIVGNAPALAPGEEPGPRDIEVEDPRGRTVVPAGITYVRPAASGTLFLRGDANGSGKADISDAVTILGYLFLGSPTVLSCAAAADIDAGGGIEITDAIQLLQYLFLGGRAPRRPFPACGPESEPDGLECGSGAPCGEGGGGAASAFALQPNVRVLNDPPLDPRDPVLVDLSTVTGEVVINDPPGGIDLAIGDVIAGFVPLTSEAIHTGVTYQLKIEERLPGSCMIASSSDKAYLSRPARLNETFEHFELNASIPWNGAEARGAAELLAAGGKTPCELEEGAGGGASAEMGSGAEFKSLIDVNLANVGIFDFHDGPNYLRAGYHKLRVLYSAGEANLGLKISGDGIEGLDFFSGIILDSEVVAYLQSHLEKTIHEEKMLASIQKHHLIFVVGVPIHFVLKADLYAGIDANAQVNLYADAGVKASFRAGLGFEFDGKKIRNLSGFEPPRLDRVPGTPNFNLDGSVTIKPYLRPEMHLFAGLFFKGVTADLGIRTEVFTRFHAAGATDPTPCFQWGIDAGMTVTMNPEIQLFGFDLFDATFDIVKLEEKDILGGELGCKQPPVALVGYLVVPLGGSRYEVHLDASDSYDPDGGPLKFRWDFNGDGICDRATRNDPRTVFLTGPTCRFDPQHGKLCVDRFAMRIRVTDDEDESVENGFWIKLPQ